jgi:hypothetical protein
VFVRLGSQPFARLSFDSNKSKQIILSTPSKSMTEFRQMTYKIHSLFKQCFVLQLILPCFHKVGIVQTLFSKQMDFRADVGLRRTCAYYRTSARAMCVRECVRKVFGTARAMCVRVARFWACDVRSHFCTLF